MKKMTNDIREKIKTYKKAHKDISELIKDFSIKGEDLSHTVIKRFMRYNEDCSNINLSGAVIGEEGGEVCISGCNFSNSNFHRTKFLCKVNASKGVFCNSNFYKCIVPDVDYQYADIRGASFCGIVTKIDTGLGKGAKVSKELITLLIKEWEIV
jgi:uncharacterized protein YjbI with pentapeptide repeats